MRPADRLLRDAAMLLSRRLNTSLAPPDRVSVNVTLRCNLSCVMCTTCYDSPELTTDEIKGIIDQTADWGVEVFNPLGGEPFMRADIEEILSYAVRRGFYVTVTTNGTLISPSRARMLARIPSDRLHLNFSFDGDEPAHDLVRGPGQFQRALEGYRRVREADATAGNSRRKILTNTILHARNLDRFEAILDAQAEAGFDGVQILNLFRQSAEVPPESRALWFYPEHYPALERLCEALALRAERGGARSPESGGSAPARHRSDLLPQVVHGVELPRRRAPRAAGASGASPGAGSWRDVENYRIQNDPHELRLIPSYYKEELKPLQAPCWAGWKELYINADGAAIMCDGKLDFLAGTFGNVREQTLRQLWDSPRLRERRAVVRQCQTPCVQTCYLRRESDSARALGAEAAGMAARALRDRISRLQPRVDHFPEATLRLELTDTCPCGWEGCSTPASRWQKLIASAPEAPGAHNWTALRDRHLIDFGRGFMGFEVVRDVVDDLRAARLRFGTLALRWRGEPLLHPEFEPILDYLLHHVARGLADRLRVETDGRFLTERLAARAGVDCEQEWIFDLDRGGGAGVELLQAARGPRTRLLVTAAAVPGLDARALARRYPLPPAIGRMPASGDALWIRRTDHDHYAANAEARRLLREAGEALGVSGELGEEDRPRRCPAPARTPTVSWDGKVVLCPRDTQLQNRLGEVTGGGRLSALWRGAGWEADRRAAAAGVPDRALCRGCGWAWSPNL